MLKFNYNPTEPPSLETSQDYLRRMALGQTAQLGINSQRTKPAMTENLKSSLNPKDKPSDIHTPAGNPLALTSKVFTIANPAGVYTLPTSCWKEAKRFMSHITVITFQHNSPNLTTRVISRSYIARVISRSHSPNLEYGHQLSASTVRLRKGMLKGLD